MEDDGFEERFLKVRDELPALETIVNLSQDGVPEATFHGAAEFDRDAVVWCVNFVQANRRLPRRLKRMLDAEGSDTFTVEMLGSFEALKDFDALSREPFVVFVEPPAVDRRILNQLALFSLMSSDILL